MQDPQPNAFIVTVVDTPAKETTLADVIFGSFGVVGALVLLAIVLGGLLSLAMMYWNKRNPPEGKHMPPVSPYIPN